MTEEHLVKSEKKFSPPLHIVKGFVEAMNNDGKSFPYLSISSKQRYEILGRILFRATNTRAHRRR